MTSEEKEVEKEDVAQSTEHDEENEKVALQEYISNLETRIKQKTELRNENLNCVRPPENHFSKLDSGLKKNTTFVKKLKSFSATQIDSLLKDFSALNLTKYISEVASAITEAKLKMSDIPAAITLCSKLHRTYAEFSSNLFENWQKILTFKTTDKISNSSKLRVDIRFYAELVTVGIFVNKTGLPLLGNVLTVLINMDKEDHNNIPILLSFCKHCGEDYAGLVPKKIRETAEKNSITIPRNTFLPAEKQAVVRQLLRDYFSSLTKHLLSERSQLQALHVANQRTLHTRGELSQERKDQLEQHQAMYDKLLAGAQSFAEVLGEDLGEAGEPPTLSLAVTEAQGSISLGGTEEYTFQAGADPWQDEDTRTFYTSLPDLKVFMPSYQIKEPIVPKSKEAVTEEMLDEELKELELSDEEAEPPPPEPEQDEPPTHSVSNKYALDSFLNELPNCINRELIDNAAVDFVLNLNTKNNRKKLTRVLFSVARTRLDLLPFYSRFAAILYPVIPDVCVDLCQMLKQDFKYHVRKKDQINIESKIKVVRFIGELVKFSLYSKMEALYCLKVLLHDFKHHHVEMACNLLETCGRYLYCNPDTHQRTMIYLQQMMRKKTVSALDSRYVTQIENAFYYVCPPEAPAQPREEEPPLHQFIRKILHEDLQKSNEEKILSHRDPELSRIFGAIVWSVYQTVSALDSRYVTQIENAFYYVCPPEAPAQPREEEPPLHQFIRKILHEDLQKSNEEKILRCVTVSALDSRYVTQIENAFYYVCPPEAPAQPREEEPPLHQFIRKILHEDLQKSNEEKILSHRDPELSRIFGAIVWSVYQTVSALDSRYVTQIENAFYYVCPPEAPAQPREEEPPLHQFIRKILHEDLQKSNEEKILRLMRKLNWEDPDVSVAGIQQLAGGWRVRASARRALARLAAELAGWQEHVAPAVVDAVLEELRLTMEDPHPRYNQRRIATVRYLGELYNYKLLDSRDVFNVLYSFITFGVTNEHGVVSPLDPPDNVFRIRLVCALLETCGAYFNSGSSKKRLDYFLVFFQNYYWFKQSDPYWTEENKFPIYVKYIYQECLLSLRPKLTLFTSWQQCKDAIEDLRQSLYPDLGEDENYDDQGDDSMNEGLDTIIESDDETDNPNLPDESSDDDMMTENTVNEDNDAVDEMNDEPRRPAAKPVEDVEFESQFERMVLENIAERQRENRPQQRDIAVPMTCRQTTKKTYEQLLQGKDDVEFVLMVRKGTKPQYKSFSAPPELASNLQTQALADKQEMERVKRLTLNISERQEEEEYSAETGGGGGGGGNPNRGQHVRQKYQHPKGAPDADLIFGPKKFK
ncbi:unnamed protein product [Plutella xylostella]|uniref:(diamondback moth) hypothetical protein n=1 Tax=Plutella xylostella TaxID=51655 RepID=A0A8S4DA94_PLUXY|nr:unnamed protein product [Plutella xylostella]